MAKKNDDTPGGRVWIAKNVKFIEDAFKKALDGFNAFQRGLEVGRSTQPHGAAAITDEPERALKGIADRHRATLSGAAHKAMLEALQVVKTRPQELNTEALVEQARRELQALELETRGKIAATVFWQSEAQGELNFFAISHGRGILGQNDYAVNATVMKPVTITAIVALIDAILHAMQFVPVMPQGLFQALTISGVTSMAMALGGALTGSAFRYWKYKVRSTRYLWRLGSILAILACTSIAVIMAQYRAVLEVVAREGGEPSLSAILATPPTIMSSTVFVAAATVFSLAVLKFRGGAGSPWATYGDHGKFDREVCQATEKFERQKNRYIQALREIIAYTINDFEDMHEADRSLLQDAMDKHDDARLHIKDLQKSDHEYFKLAVLEIQRYRDGVLSVRPEVVPEQFKALPEFEAQDFPDINELDESLAETKSVFEARTKALAALQIEVGQLEREAMDRFGGMVDELRGQVPKKREDWHKISRIGGALAGDLA